MRYLSCISLAALLLPTLTVAQDTPTDSVSVVVDGVTYLSYEALFGVQFEENIAVGPRSLVATAPAEACDPITNGDEVFGNIALISRGSCAFTTKVQQASDAGAVAVVVYPDEPVSPGTGGPDDLILMAGDCAPDVCTAPAVFVSFNSGQAILAALASGPEEAVLDPIRVTPVPKDLVVTPTLPGPVGAPVSVAPGGSVSFSVSITNNTDEAASGDLFFTAERDGRIVASGDVRSGTVEAGQTVMLTYTQEVPGNAAEGRYNYLVNISEIPPGDVDDTEAFAVTVTGAARAAGAVAWSVVDATPWEVVEDVAVERGPGIAAASTGASVSAYPNPFADRTEIGFVLDRASDVSLVVYDVRGRTVATLAEGAREAGAHQAVFDGSGLPSGVYVYRLVADGHVETGRITLVR